MVQVEIHYQGKLRTEASHGPSGAKLLCDAPVDNHGRGESFSPTDLVAAALGTCMLTIMGIQAEKRGWDLSGATATVEKGMVADPMRRIGRLGVTIRVPAELDEEAREVLERAALSCPVAESISPDIQSPVTFVWGTD